MTLKDCFNARHIRKDEILVNIMKTSHRHSVVPFEISLLTIPFQIQVRRHAFIWVIVTLPEEGKDVLPVPPCWEGLLYLIHELAHHIMVKLPTNGKSHPLTLVTVIETVDVVFPLRDTYQKDVSKVNNITIY